MIVTDWAAAREAIVEQRGERLAEDIEALLRERELLAEEKTMMPKELIDSSASAMRESHLYVESLRQAERRLRSITTLVKTAEERAKIGSPFGWEAAVIPLHLWEAVVCAAEGKP